MTLIERAIRSYINWRYKRASARNYKIILRQNPILRRYDLEETKARRGHKPVAPIQAARQAAVTEMLKGGHNANPR